MINLAYEEKPVALKSYNPNQTKWLEEKFGHLKPIIKANAQLKDKA